MDARWARLSLTASKAVQRKDFGPLLAGVFHAHYPNSYRGTFGNNPAATPPPIALGYIENELFKRIVDPEDVAGIIVEPIQGEGGYLAAPAEFLQGLQALCRKHGILLIADEVQSGMGRTGKWWASDHAGIEPDIICSAKGIASGMPLSAIITRASVMNWKPGAHASTFGGNPVAIAASLATIDLLEREIQRQRRAHGRTDFLAHRRLARTPQNRRRSSRQGPDDRHRTGARSEDQGKGAAICAIASSRWRSTRAC